MLQQEDRASRPSDRNGTEESKYDSGIYSGEEGGGEEIKDKLEGGKHDCL